MLSPDVPEFVPRECQTTKPPETVKPAASADINFRSQLSSSTDSYHVQHSYSASPGKSKEETGNWRDVRHSPSWGWGSSNKSDYSHRPKYSWSSDSNWRHTDNHNLNSSKNDDGMKKSHRMYPSHEVSEGMEIWGERKGNKLYDFHHDGKKISQAKSNVLTESKFDTQIPVEASSLQISSEFSLQANVSINMPRKFEDHVTSSLIANDRQTKAELLGGMGKESKENQSSPDVNDDKLSNKVMVSQQSKVKKIDFPVQGRHHGGNVSYKKILSRENYKEDKKTNSSVGLVPFQGEENWPSLSSTHHLKTESDSLYDNVWTKVTKPHPESWPKSSPGEMVVPVSSDQQKVNISEGNSHKSAKNNSARRDKNRNKTLQVKEENVRETKSQSGYQGRRRTSQDNQSLSSDGPSENVRKVKPTNKNQLDNEKGDLIRHQRKWKDKRNTQESANVSMTSQSLDISKTATILETNNLETGESISPAEEDASQWQVMRKKKTRETDQEKRGLETKPNSQVKAKGDSKQTASKMHVKYSDVGKSYKPKERETQAEKNLHAKDKKDSTLNKKYKTVQIKDSDGKESGSEIMKKTFREGARAPIENHQKVKAAVEGRDQKSRNNESNSKLNLKTTDHSGVNTEKNTAISKEDKPSVEDIEIQKVNAAKRARRKEEKMRKREERLKRAQAVMASDSKVRMISSDLLNIVHNRTDGGKKSSSSVPTKKKSTQEGDLHLRTKDNFQLSCVEYPSLSSDAPKTFNDYYSKSFTNPAKSSHEIRPQEQFHNPSIVSHSRLKTNMSSKPLGAKSVKKNHENAWKRSTSMNNEQDVPTAGDIQEKDVLTAEDRQDPEAVLSYSKAVLAASKKVAEKTVSKTAPPKVNASKINTPKKKVRTRDGITFDLMDAVNKKKKQMPENVSEFGQFFVSSSKKKTQSKKEVAAATTVLDIPGRKLNKPVTEIVTKRGKQHTRKKKLSKIKRAIKNRKQIEAENLMYILQEAKKLYPDILTSSVPLTGSTSALLNTLIDLSAKPLSDTASQDLSSEDQLKPLDISAKLVSDTASQDLSSENQLKPLDISAQPVSDTASQDLSSENLLKPLDLTSDEVSDLSKAEISCAKNIFNDNPEVVNGKECSKEIKESFVCHSDEKVIGSNDDMKLKDLDEPSNDKKDEEIKTNDSTKVDVAPDFSKKCADLLEEMGVMHKNVHKKTFREYCNHVITPEVNQAAVEFIKTLVGFQERQYQRDPVKARIRRRYVCGLRSTIKSMRKMSCLIVAPDIERCKGQGALDEVVEKLLTQAENHGVPVIFALACKRLGRLSFKKVPVSCIGIINYHGAQDIFHRLMELLPEVKKQYQDLIASGKQTLPIGDEPPDEESVSGVENAEEIKVTNSSLSTEDKDTVTLHVHEEIIASTVAILNDKVNES